VLVVLFLGPAEFEHRLQLQGRAVDNRALIWQDCVFRMFPEFPITGAGAGTFLYSFQPYHSVPDKRLATHAESDWMQTLTGVGLIGVLLLLWAAVRFVRAMKAGLEGEVTPDRVFLGAALTGVLSLVLHGFVDVNLQIPANGMYFAILSGLCLAVARQQGGRGVLHWIDGSAGRLRQEEVET